MPVPFLTSVPPDEPDRSSMSIVIVCVPVDVSIVPPFGPTWNLPGPFVLRMNPVLSPARLRTSVPPSRMNVSVGYFTFTPAPLSVPPVLRRMMPTPVDWLPMVNSYVLVEAKRSSPPFSMVTVPVPCSAANTPKLWHSHTPLPVIVSVPTPPG